MTSEPEQGADRASLQGRVVEAGHGTAVAGAAAEVWQEGRLVREAATDVTGAFLVEGLPPGEYEVRAEKVGYAAARQGARLEAGHRAKLEVALTGSGGISGRVLQPDSRPLVGAAVHAVREGVVMALARSREDGGYRLRDLPPGRYEVVAQSRRLGAASADGVEIAGDPAERDVAFDAARAPAPLSAQALRQGLADIWTYRHLVYNLVRRDMRTRYKGSVLGLFWSMLLPLAMIAIYWFVFTFLWAHNKIHNYTMFIFCGLVPWLYFMYSVGDGCTAILSNREMIRRVRVPPAVFPVAVVLQNLVHFFLMLIVFMVVLRLVPVHFFAPVVMLPVLIVLEVMLLVGLAFFLSALNTFYHDVAYAVGVMLNFMLFLSPILYPAGEVLQGLQSRGLPGWLFTAFMMNPVAILTTSYRDIFLGRIVTGATLAEYVPVFPHGHWMLALAVEAVVFLVGGYVYFIKSQPRFSDVL